VTFHTQRGNSTAGIVIARKPGFQLNPKIRCLVFVILDNKKFLGKELDIFFLQNKNILVWLG
jgi:hypothetical protein